MICLTATKTNLEYFSSPDNTFLGFGNSDENVVPPIPSTNDIGCEERVENVKLSYGIEQEKSAKRKFYPNEILQSQRDLDGDAGSRCSEGKATLTKNSLSERKYKKNNAIKKWKQDQVAEEKQHRKTRNNLEAQAKQLQKQDGEQEDGTIV